MKLFSFLKCNVINILYQFVVYDKIDYPIIMCEGNDIEIIDNESDIQRIGIESIDIINCEYIFYDRNGFLIEAKVENNYIFYKYPSPMINKIAEMRSRLQYFISKFINSNMSDDLEILIQAVRCINNKKRIYKQ